MRPIDADALIPSEVHTVVVRKADGEEVWASVLYAEQIDNAPTVDAEPVRHGHWSKRQDGELYNLPFSVVCCSVCGNPQSTETPYCSNCGAKMDEEG